jgi:hypothetical protein
MGELRFTVFGTIGQSLAVWARNLLSILILGLIFFSPLIIYTIHEVGEVRANGGLSEARGMWWVLITVAFSYAADQFLAAPIVYGVVQELNGTRAGVLACVAQGIKRFFPVFFTIFMLYWCVAFGSYPFVIPGLVLASGLYVAVPCAVCERPGVMGTLTRSFNLTEGNRMRIFGLLILFWGARIGAKYLLIKTIDPQGDSGKIQMLLVASLAVDFFFGTVGAVMQGVSYSRMRQLKDGVSAADLAAVFE